MLAVGSVQAAAVLANGIVTFATLSANPQLARIPLNGCLLSELQFLLTSAATTTRTYKLWAGKYLYDQNGNLDKVQCHVRLVGYGTATAGTQAGTANGTAILSTERVCDTLTFTPTTTGTANKGPQQIIDNVSREGVIDAATGNVYSPADNTFAALFNAALGRADFMIVEFYDNNAARIANVLYSISRP